jgi:hypothetical protein
MQRNPEREVVRGSTPPKRRKMMRTSSESDNADRSNHYNDGRTIFSITLPAQRHPMSVFFMELNIV